MSEKVQVHVPQADGQITGIDNDGSKRRWIVKEHLIEVDQSDLRRILSTVRGSRTVAESGRDQSAESKPDESQTSRMSKPNGRTH